MTRFSILFIRNFDTSLPNIVADRDKLHQVLLNLIRNAVEASFNKAIIKVKTRYCGKWELAGTNLNPELNIRGILLTMFDKRNKLYSLVDDEERKYFKE